MKLFKFILIAGLCSLFSGLAVTAEPKQAENTWYKSAQTALAEKLKRTPNTNKALNIILFVSDGNGIGSNYASRLYMGQKAGGYGDEFVLPYEKMPYLGLVKTYNTNAQTPDSAGTATALNAGVKSRSGIIGLDDSARLGECGDVEKAKATSFADLMHQDGKSIGIVSTARITHATPAAVYAHSAHRNWEDDSKLPEGCMQKDIAMQLAKKMLAGKVNFAMGGGYRSFLPMRKNKDGKKTGKGRRTDGQNLIEKIKSANIQYAFDKKSFNDLRLDGKTSVLGLFSPSHMKFEHDRKGEPSLTEMTEAAIKYLSENKKGYFLMVEGGRVDHAHHGNNLHRAVTDNIAFAKAVEKAMELTSEQNTLIIVTADHAHGLAFNGYCGRGSPVTGLCYKVDTQGEKHKPEPNISKDGKTYTVTGYLNGPGSNVSNEKEGLTNEKAMNPNYLHTTPIPLRSEAHSGADVAIYASGPWAHLFDGTMEQNYIFHVMRHAVQPE